MFLLVLPLSCRAGGVTKVSESYARDNSLPAYITVATWNIQKVIDPQLPGDLLALIEQHNPDIVFLQEASVELLQPGQMGGYLANGWKYPWPGGQTIGVLTLSKLAPQRIEPVPTKYRELFVTAPKVSLVTEHLLPNGETLLAVNVHLLNFERWGTSKMRSQLDELKSIMAHHSGPIIMAGDFNTWNQKRLAVVAQVIEDLHLSEVTGFPPGRKSADLDASCLNWVFGIDKHLVLDRVYQRGFMEDSAQVLPFNSSDHRPILVRLILKPTKT
jgi:endonuclease/exonuclease/phosphatase (EEP) superfamily protein YafD